MSEPFSEKSDSPFPGPGKASSISLALDDFEDIFSDFDPRPDSERLLSEDLLHELKRASLDRDEEGLALNLLIPKDQHNSAREKVILDRLKQHFRRHHRRLEEKRKKDNRTGFQMVALGILFMMAATYLLTCFPQTLWRSMIVVLLEPAGWFTFWEGLSLLLFYSKEAKPDLVFYRKMSGAKIGFVPVE